MQSENSGRDKSRRMLEIARLGSLAYQERWCLEGTRDEYVLLDELCDTTITAVESDANHPVLSRKWTPDERLSLLTFAKTASSLFREVPWQDSRVSLEQIVRDNPSMAATRQAANQCLREIGVSFTADAIMEG